MLEADYYFTQKNLKFSFLVQKIKNNIVIPIKKKTIPFLPEMLRNTTNFTNFCDVSVLLYCHGKKRQYIVFYVKLCDILIAFDILIFKC